MQLEDETLVCVYLGGLGGEERGIFKCNHIITATLIGAFICHQKSKPQLKNYYCQEKLEAVPDHIFFLKRRKGRVGKVDGDVKLVHKE